jgi:hypothetical protein
MGMRLVIELAVCNHPLDILREILLVADRAPVIVVDQVFRLAVDAS